MHPSIELLFIAFPFHEEYTTTRSAVRTSFNKKDPYTDDVKLSVDFDLSPFVISQKETTVMIHRYRLPIKKTSGSACMVRKPL
jgi:hypothetical protein